jgi:antitoxin component YwqK of YwqJK toxin-antitoxin module
MNNMRRLFLLPLFLTLFGCHDSSDKNFVQTTNKKASNIIGFDKYLFSFNKINSSAILDTLEKMSDTILFNTSIKPNTREGTIYVNNEADTKYVIYEYSKESISAIGYFRNDNNINTVEYYPNGQVMCKFSVLEDGIRDGHYACFEENGIVRSSGFYANRREVKDSARLYDSHGKIQKQMSNR